MKGRLVTILAAMSLALCLATAAAWGLAHFYQAELDYVTDAGGYGLSNGPHQLVVQYSSGRGNYGLAVGRPERGLSFQHSAWNQLRSYEVESVNQSGGISLTGHLRFEYPVRWNPPSTQKLGFGWEHYENMLMPLGGMITTYWRVAIPFWFLIVLTAPLPLRRAWLWRRQRDRRRRGLCLACGYDLRHSPGRCPECGAGIPVGATA